VDVDKEEAEKARAQAAKEAKPSAMAGVRPAKPGAASPGAASFSDQMSAAKTQRDPLLDRIAPSDKAKTPANR
jgi:hypothetical protein